MRLLVNPMGWLVALLLLVVPWLEVWLLFRLDQALPVVLLQGVGTAAVGWWFARREDLSLWTELESDIQNHRVPTEEALDAMLMVLGGWGLIVPGWITDVAGAALLVPAVRRLLMPWLR
ncbi:MAG TPA: FxsA family protein, partial [bacterium]